MSNDIQKMMPSADGFAGYEDRSEGDDQQQADGVIKGAVIKFTNEAAWVTRDDTELSADLELVATDVRRIVQKWVDQLPVETRLGPKEKFPDLEQLNKACPEAEWSDGPDGKPRGPWQRQHLLYLRDFATLDEYSYPTGTTGGFLAIRELVEKIQYMRKFKGPHLFPVVSLSDKFMKTRFGGRQRPHFIIKRWIVIGGDEEQQQVLLPASAGPALAPASTADEPAVEVVAKPAAKLQTNKRGVTRATVVAEPTTTTADFNDKLPI